MIQGRPEISEEQKKIERNKSEKIKQDRKQTNKKRLKYLFVIWIYAFQFQGDFESHTSNPDVSRSCSFDDFFCRLV